MLILKLLSIDWSEGNGKMCPLRNPESPEDVKGLHSEVGLTLKREGYPKEAFRDGQLGSPYLLPYPLGPLAYKLVFNKKMLKLYSLKKEFGCMPSCVSSFDSRGHTHIISILDIVIVPYCLEGTLQGCQGVYVVYF